MEKIKVLGASSPVWANHEQTAITLSARLSHLPHMSIQFTATADDTEEHGRELFVMAKFGKYGEIKPCPMPTDAEMDMLTFPARKKAALAKVEERITVLSRAARLEMSTKEEDAELLKLEKYSILLMRAAGPTIPANT